MIIKIIPVEHGKRIVIHKEWHPNDYAWRYYKIPQEKVLFFWLSSGWESKSKGMEVTTFGTLQEAVGDAERYGTMYLSGK